MNPFRLLVAVLAFALSAAAPGQSRDGAAPSDGAIKGGTILPGETGGMPDRAKMKKRCDELSGTLREDCLKQEREAGSGETKPLSDTRKKSPAPAD